MLIIIILLNSVSRQFWCYSIGGVDGSRMWSSSFIIYLVNIATKNHYFGVMCGNLSGVDPSM